ncbi:MAG: peptidoglycan-binding domain-containing protein [Myxococcota bacterium]
MPTSVALRPVSSAPRQRSAEAPSLQTVAQGGALLTRGAEGQSVRDLQQLLGSKGFPVDVDGDFGPRTEWAVRQFQRSRGLDVDGKVGPQTLRALQGNSGATVTDGMERRPNGAPTPRAPTEAERNSRPEGTIRAGDLQQPRPSTAGAPPNRTAEFQSVSKAGQRNQMMTGQITVNGNTYTFRTGGHGRGNLPKGDYTITPHLWSRNDRSMNVGGVGYSFAMSDKYDPRVGGTRSLLRIHPDGGSAGTEGCIGIVGDAATQRRFREDMRAELARNGGRFTLTVR